MPIKDMPAFVMSHKQVRYAIGYCIASCVCLVIELILMDKNAINIVFDIIIPFTAAVCFACYAITMAMDRPIILICPPTVFFVSLLINQLIAVEVGVRDTYPFITMIEMIPYAFFCVCCATCKFKRITDRVLRVFGIALVIASIIIAVLAVFFRIIIFINRTHYMMNTFAMIASFYSIIFMYSAMIELVKIAGVEKRLRKHNKKKSAVS
ncbi:MAG: hypothetical protein E7573_00565 [Ruminococcaceae bacterium]|nr:hypothetical protein [Oscillospiraceae bacterium]MBR3595842.1 hypothetical protein [Clostridia bacterium]